MKRVLRSAQSGIALIIVMICITVLSILAASFAYSMKTETRLARNANAEADFYRLGQSAVDYCKSVLVASAACPDEVWKGKLESSCSNNLVEVMQYGQELGKGRFTWEIYDMERKANINSADQLMLDQAMRLLGVDAGDAGATSAAILDWIDRDDNPHISGAESDYYQSLDPPYDAKNGFMDDISELKQVRGGRELFGSPGQAAPPPPPSFRDQIGFAEPPIKRANPEDLFTTISSGQININTASPEVLQLVPFIDEATAQRIIWCREGQDTGQAIPFRNAGEALNCAQVNPQIIAQIQGRFTTRSSTFEVRIDAEIDGVHRYYNAVLRRNQRDVQVLTFHWKMTAPESNADTP